MRVSEMIGFTFLIGMIVVASASLSGCASTPPAEVSEAEELGQYLMRQTGPEVDVVVGYRFAAQSVAEEWLLLELALSSPRRQQATIERGDVFVRTPDGKRIPLATQEEFGQAFGALRPKIHQANVMRDPMGYFAGNRRQCAIEFFAAPGSGVTFDRVTVNDRRACEGKFFFKVPGGIQSGRWVLGIDLTESKIRIPFRL